jgi:hypothetical protein
MDKFLMINLVLVASPVLLLGAWALIVSFVQQRKKKKKRHLRIVK